MACRAHNADISRFNSDPCKRSDVRDEAALIRLTARVRLPSLRPEATWREHAPHTRARGVRFACLGLARAAGRCRTPYRRPLWVRFPARLRATRRLVTAPARQAGERGPIPRSRTK